MTRTCWVLLVLHHFDCTSFDFAVKKRPSVEVHTAREETFTRCGDVWITFIHDVTGGGDSATSSGLHRRLRSHLPAPAEEGSTLSLV